MILAFKFILGGAIIYSPKKCPTPPTSATCPLGQIKLAWIDSLATGTLFILGNGV